MTQPYYERGGIQIFNADCLDVLPTLAAVDHVICDPPYARDVYQRLGMPNTKVGSGTPGRLRSHVAQQPAEPRVPKIAGQQRFSSPELREKGAPRLGIQNHQYSSMSIEKLAAGAIGHIDEMLSDVAAEIARLTARWSLVFSDVESCHLWRLALEGNGMRYVRTGAWFKVDPMPQFSGDRPAVGFEPCTITHAKGPMRWNGGGMPATWRYGTVKTDRPDHPCPKPLPLMRELVSLFTDPEETILDPFGGSMTTAVAAQALGRHCICVEVDERYCEIGAKRLAQMPMDLLTVAAPLSAVARQDVMALEVPQ